MKLYTQWLIPALLLCLFAGCSSEAGKDQSSGAGTAAGGADITFFSGARLIPGDGSAPIEEATFIVENGKFTQIGMKNEVKPPKGAGRVDLTGRTIMPVLVNLQGHVGLNNGATFSPRNYTSDSVKADLNRYEYYGVYALGTSGTDPGDTIFQIREQQRQGQATGAMVFTAGRGITARGGYPSGAGMLGDIPIEVSSETEARKAVNDLADQKVDFIKIWVDDNGGKSPKLRPEIARAVINEGHMYDIRTVAEVSDLADAKQLVKDGVDGLVHSIQDREVDNDLISMMKEKDVFYAPALTSDQAKFVYADEPSWLGEQSMREVYPAQLSAYLANSIIVRKFKRDPDAQRARRQYSTAEKNLKKMADAGVKIALGSDSGGENTYPGYFEHRELQLMVDAGLSPMDAIKAATSVSASVLKLDDIGTLAPGKRAEFLVLSANPLTKIANTREIYTIYRDGQELDRLALIQNLTMDYPQVTQRDRNEDAAARAREAQLAAEAKMEHFGKFVLGPSANVRAMPVPTPKGSRADIKAGPPDRITISMRASASDLRAFYVAALPKYHWQPQGDCWGRRNPISNKQQVLCAQTSANRAVLQITEK